MRTNLNEHCPKCGRLYNGYWSWCICPATHRSPALRITSPVDLHSIKTKARKHWKWLAASALGVAWITLSCGLSVLPMKPVCTSITMAIRGLLSPIATQAQPRTNNIKTASTSLKNGLLLRPTFKNSSALCERQIKAIKSAISTAESMANSAVLTITSVYSITPSMTNICGRTIKVSIRTPLPNSKNTGRTALPPVQNLPYRMPPTLPAIASRKLPANVLMTTTYAATKTAKRTGYCQNTSACPPDAANLQE